jgi:hypothetical protein
MARYRQVSGRHLFAGQRECTLKAVALKPATRRNRVREKDAQRTATGYLSDEYASAPRGARAEPRGSSA